MRENLNLPLCEVVTAARANFTDLSTDEARLKAGQWCASCGIRSVCYADKVTNTPPGDLDGELWAGVYFDNGKGRVIKNVEASSPSLYEQTNILVSSLREDLINTRTQYYGRHDQATKSVARGLEGVYEKSWKYPEVQELCRRMIIALMRHPDVGSTDTVAKELENIYASLNSYFEAEIDKMYEYIPCPQQDFLVRYLTFRSAKDYPEIRDELAGLGLPGGYGSWQVVHNPRDPIAAAKRFNETTKVLGIANPDVPYQVLADVVRNYPTTADKQLDYLRNESERITSSELYSDIPEEVVLVAIMGRKNTDQAMQSFKARLDRVQDYAASYDYLIDNLTPLEVMRITARVWRPWDTLWSVARLKRSGFQVSLDTSRDDAMPIYSKLEDKSPEGLSPEDLLIGDENKSLLRQHISTLLEQLDAPHRQAVLMWYGIDDLETNAARPFEIEEKVAGLLECDVQDIDSFIQRILANIRV